MRTIGSVPDGIKKLTVPSLDLSMNKIVNGVSSGCLGHPGEPKP